MIFIDLDGVLVDFVGGVSRLLGVPVVAHVFGLGEMFGMSNSAAWRAIDQAGADFWSGLEPLPWAGDVVEIASAEKPVGFLSSSGGYPNADAGKRAWLRKHFGTEIADELIIVGTKQRKWMLSAPGRVLVDDHAETVTRWGAHGGQGILFPATWNEAGHELRDPIAYLRTQLAGGGQ